MAPRARTLALTGALGGLWALSACAPPAPASEAAAPGLDDAPPARIVSLDYCADQFVLRLVEDERILAVSPDATKTFSYMRAAAADVPTVRPRAEDVLLLEPDLIVRSYGGGPNAAAFFARAGVRVVNIGWSRDLEDVMANIEAIADGLGAHERGAAVVTEMRARLAALPARASGARALYMTPAGVTTGPGSLVHEMLRAANLENFQETPGWRPIPLERLAYEQPDVVAAAFFGALTNHPDAWSPMKHPVARAQLRARATVPLDGAWTACGGWFLMDAVEALAAARAP